MYFTLIKCRCLIFAALLTGFLMAFFSSFLMASSVSSVVNRSGHIIFDGVEVEPLKCANLDRIQNISLSCKTLVNDLPLPSVEEAMEKDGLNGLEYVEQFNGLKIDLSIYYERMAKVTTVDKAKLGLARIDSLLALMVEILKCPHYKNIFMNSRDYSLCASYLRRIRFYGSAFFYIIHRYEVEDVYRIPPKYPLKMIP